MTRASAQIGLGGRWLLIAGWWVGSLSCGLGGGVSLPQDPIVVPSCGDARCSSEIEYQAQISAAQPDDVLGWTITLCHQDICVSGRLARILDGSDFAVRFAGPIEASGSLQLVPLSTTDYTLTVRFTGPGEDYQPGDRFTIQVLDSARGALKLHTATQAASYRDERPNDDDCPPLCRFARLDP